MKKHENTRQRTRKERNVFSFFSFFFARCVFLFFLNFLLGRWMKTGEIVRIIGGNKRE